MDPVSPEGLIFRVDLHSHTRYSTDAWTTPAELVERAAEVGLDRIAVTDHGEIEGALEARELDPGRVIVGQEIRCRGGTELLGLFLTSRVPMDLELLEVSERVRDQGGIVYAPHPFAYATRAAHHAKRAIGVADILEVFNSRAFLPRWNRRAELAAREFKLPAFAGSDAHFPWEIGRAATLLPSFDTAAELLVSAREARPVGARTASPAIHGLSLAVRATRKISGWPRHRPDRSRQETHGEGLAAPRSGKVLHHERSHRIRDR